MSTLHKFWQYGDNFRFGFVVQNIVMLHLGLFGCLGSKLFGCCLVQRHSRAMNARFFSEQKSYLFWPRRSVCPQVLSTCCHEALVCVHFVWICWCQEHVFLCRLLWRGTLNSEAEQLRQLVWCLKTFMYVFRFGKDANSVVASKSNYVKHALKMRRQWCHSGTNSICEHIHLQPNYKPNANGLDIYFHCRATFRSACAGVGILNFS